MNNITDMPAKLHRDKLFSLFEDHQNAVIYISGAEIMYRFETDYEFPFRQESNFLYLTGINEPDYQLILDLNKNEYHLFAPKRSKQFAVWHGRIKDEDEIRELYSPDHLHSENDVLKVLHDINPGVIYCLDEEQAEFLEDLDRDFKSDTEALSDAITFCRCIKTEWELNQLREASRINNIAHREVMSAIRPGMFEYELKAVFDYHQIRHGLMQEAYTGIHASGPNSAILHYVENNRQARDGELYLIDAGYELNGYASDFTRTYPVNGKFTEDQAAIYKIVLNAQKNVIEETKPGIRMEDLHMAAAKIITGGLKELGILEGTVDDLMENNIFALFFPHGLGHFLGLDTHDVGGYPKGVDRIDRPGIKYLRVRRELLPGMVITIEPGLYFIPALLKPALEDETKKKFLNRDKLESFLDFGGIRIEDNLIVTDDGYENMTDVPKEIIEIERTIGS